MLIYCPSCHMLLRLPPVAGGGQTPPGVRCPSCQATFDSPTVDADPGAVSVPTAVRIDGEQGVAQELSLGVAQEIEAEDNDRGDSLAAASESAATFALPPRVKRGSSNQRNRGGIPFVAVILGGLTALPLATAICWYALGRDPLRWGPAVARYVPALVPAKFGGTLGSSRPEPVQTQAGGFESPP